MRRPAQSILLLLLLLLALPATALLCALGLPGAPVARAAEVRALTIGTSGQGRPISAVRFGSGPLKLVVVGDTHGAPEANTYTLTNQLIDHFRANPGDVPPGVRLYLIPTLNPDGLALGTRFNASGVDLNRNMNTDLDACPENDWRTTVQGAYGLISDTGGPYPDSEPESRVIRGFLLDANGAIFLHSNAGLVFPAFCEHQPSIRLGEVYAAGAGYLYSRYWPKYMITGGMHDWAASLGIAAITPELVTGDDSEFGQNLAGLRAVLAEAADLVPPLDDHVEAGVPVPALIWRYWKSRGGVAAFGAPLAPAARDGPVTRQVFERAVLELRPDRADTPDLVRPAPLGRIAAAGQRLAPVPRPPDAAWFPETGHTLRGPFRDYWERGGGLEVFGFPLTEEVTAAGMDGARRLTQFFERAMLTYDEAAGVRREPLGRAALLRERLAPPSSRYQLR